jgi:hypothetical protein
MTEFKIKVHEKDGHWSAKFMSSKIECSSEKELQKAIKKQVLEHLKKSQDSSVRVRRYYTVIVPEENDSDSDYDGFSLFD